MRIRYILFLVPIISLFINSSQVSGQNSDFLISIWIDGVYAADGKTPLNRMPDGYGGGFEGRWRCKASLSGLGNCNTNINNCGCNNTLPCACDCVGERIIKSEDNATWKEWKFGYDLQNARIFSKVYSSLPSGTTINLSDAYTLRVDMRLEAWEEDGCGSDNTFNETCGEHNSDDNPTSETISRYLSNLSPNLEDNYIVNMPWNNVWAAEFRVWYKIDAINENQNIQTGFFSGPGNTNYQTSQEFCKGKNITYRIPLKPGFSGGYYKWYYKDPNTNQWVFDQYTTNEFLTKTVGDRILEYKATPERKSGYLFTADGTTQTPAGVGSYTVFKAPSQSDITLAGSIVCGTAKGTISVNVANPAGTYKVALYNGNLTTENAISNATYLVQNDVSTFPYQIPGTYNSGMYTVVIRGAGQNTFGCLEYKSVSIISVPVPQISATATQPLCAGQTGTVSVTYSGGGNVLVSSVTYTLLNASTNQTVGQPYTVNSSGFPNFSIPGYTFTNVPAGSYKVRANNNTGCSFTTPNAITVNAAPASLNVSATAPNLNGSGYNVTCYGDPVPITINASGGTPGYYITVGANQPFLINQNSTVVNYSTLTNTSLNIQVRDQNNCTAGTSIPLTIPNGLLGVTLGAASPSLGCNPTGTITLSGTGGAGNYLYQVDNQPFASNTFWSGLAVGPHTARVRDASGCEASQDFITQTSIFTPQVHYDVTQPTCFGTNDGSILSTVTGGTIPITFALYQGANFIALGPDFYNLAPGDYTIHYSDETNCLINTDIKLVEPNDLEMASAIQIGPDCAGFDALVKGYFRGRANGIAGDQSFEYSTDGGATWNTQFDYEDDGDLIGFYLYVTPPANLQLKVRDNVCESNNTLNFQVNEVLPITATLKTVTPTSCSANQDGSLTLNVTGGLPPYTIVLCRYENGGIWYDIAETDTLRGGQGDYTFSGLQTSISGGFAVYTGGYFFLIFDQGSDNFSCKKSFPSGYYQEGMFTPISIGVADPVEITSVESIGGDIGCSGNNGILRVTAAKGTPPYSYSLGGTVYQSSNVLTGAGLTNEVFVKDKFGCISASVTADIPEAPVTLNFTADVTHNVSDCRKGQIEVHIFNGPAPYQITLAPTGQAQEICYEGAAGALRKFSSNSATVFISDLDTGEYTICIRDAATCQTDRNVTITRPDSLSIAVTQFQDESCRGFADGSVSLAASGGYPPYTITKSFGNPVNGASATYSSLAFGNYIFTVEDHEGCLKYVTQSIGYGKDITLQNSSVAPPCADLPLGSLTIAPINGTPPYTCYWLDDPTTIFSLGEGEPITRDSLPVTELFFHVTDSEGCAQTLQAVLTGPDYVTAQAAISPAACGGVSDGRAAIVPFGGTAPFQYSLDSLNYQTDSIFYGLSAGVYTVYLIDANGCRGSQQFTVGTLIDLEASVSSTPATCANGMNGALSGQVLNGLPPYEYALNSGSFGQQTSFSNLAPGNYTVYFRDSQGCLGDTVVTVGAPPAITLSSYTQSSVTCPGGNDGSLTFNVAGGTPPFKYSIDGGATYQNSNKFNNLIAGNYVLTILDNVGCVQNIQGIVLNQPAPLSVSVQINQIASCGLSVGAASVTATGGTPNANPPFYAYEWDNLPYLNLPFWNSVPPGAHSVKVTDSKGCITTQNFVMDQSPALNAGFDAVVPDTCAREHGSISLAILSGTAPYILNWSNGEQTSTTLLENLGSGNYSVTITDAYQCSIVLQTSVNEIQGPGLNLENVQNSICADGLGSIAVEAVSGTLPYAYAWSHNAGLNASNADNLTQGTYTVTISDANGCSATISQAVLYIEGPQSGSANVLDAACDQPNGQITASFNGGTLPYHFEWSHNAGLDNAIAGQLATGTYTVTATDANNCTLTLTETIGNLPGPALSAGAGAPSACDKPNGQVSVSVSSGTSPYTFSWSHNNLLNSAAASNLLAGDYTVTVTDARGCTATLTQTVGAVAGPAIESLDAAASLCTDGQGSLTANLVPNLGTAPFTYTWNHDNTATGATVNNLFSGSYTVTVTDANQCTAVQSAQVDLIAGPAISNISVQNSLCTDGNGGLSVSVTQGASAYVLQWSHDPNENGETLQNLAAGTYTVTVSDDSGCTDTGTATVELKTPPSFLQPTVQNTSCGLSAGSITTQLSGGTPTYTFTWSHNPNASGNSQSGLPEGNYTVTVTDANGCTDTTEAGILNQPAPTVELSNVVSDNCNQGVGSISVTATGLAPLSYSWSHNAFVQQNQALFLIPGSYTVTVSDANGCTASLNADVPNTPGVTALAVATNSLCTNDNGSIAVTANGNAAPFQYSWSHNALLSTPNISGLPAGTYTVTVTDTNGCTSVQNASVNLEGTPTLSAQATQTACSNPTGTVTLQTSGGTQPYQFTWSHDPDLNAAQAAGLSAATYSVTVSDLNGCSSATSIEVTQTPGPQDITNNGSDADCGLANGTIVVKVTTGTGPYTYNWAAPGLSGNTAVNLSAGMYPLTITDANGCTALSVPTVSNINSPAVNLAAKTDAYCGLPNGSATASISGGAQPVSIQWFAFSDLNNAISSALSVSNLAAGSYIIAATDAVGCQRYLQVDISGTPGFTLTASAESASCFGSLNGSALAEVSGGSAPFQYMWSNSSQAQGISGVGAGVFTVTVTDALGCSQTATATVSQSPAVVVTAVNIIKPTCASYSNGTILVNASGGNGGFDYQWNGGQAGDALSGVSAGVYTVIATDQAGCSGQLSVPLNDPLPIGLNFTQIEPLCFGAASGSITAQVSGGNGGFQYQWSNGQTTPIAFSVGAGSYTLTVTDNNVCSAVGSVTISAPDQIVVNALTLSPACGSAADGQISATAVGGSGTLSFQWSDPTGQTTATAVALGAGLYQVTVTDANGCSATTQATVSSSPAVTAMIAQIAAISCPGASDGALQVSAGGGTGAFSYVWSDPSGQTTAVAANLAAGAYSVTVQDAVGCTTTSGATLQAANDYVVNVSGINSPTCFGLNNGSISLFVPGSTAGFSFIWNDPAAQTTQNAQNLAPGNYQVTVSNANGCTKVLSATVPSVGAVSISAGALTPPLCFGQNNGSAQAIATGGTGTFSYQWSDPQNQQTQTAFALIPGQYTVTATDQNGCSASLQVTVPNVTQVQAQVNSVNSPLCAGQANGNATASGTGGTGVYNWLWSNNGQTTQTAINLLPGNYTVTVSDQNGCTATATATISPTPALNLALANNNPPSCAGLSNGSLSVNGSGGTGALAYAWSTTPAQNGPSAANLAAGAYTVTLSDQNGCTATATYTVNAVNAVSLNFSAVNPVCASSPTGSLTVAASGGTQGYNYIWNNGQTTATATSLTAGAYTVTVTDQNGCTASGSGTVSSTNPAINSSVFNNQPTGCAGGLGGALTLSASGGTGLLQFTWSNGNTGFQQSNLGAGNYTVTITDAVGCTGVLTATVQEGPVFTVDLGGADTSICGGDAVIYELPGADIGFAWAGPSGFSSNSANVILVNSGIYTVTASHPAGCTATDQINVSISPDPLAAFFVIATEVVQGDTIVAVEVSWPAPNNVQWEFDPNEVELIGQDLNQYFFKFLTLGEVNLGMRANIGTCSDAIYKKIKVYATAAELPPFVDRSELIQFLAAPNPNTGVFNIIVEFEEQQSAVLSIFRANGQPVDRRILQGDKVYNQGFNISQPGIYSAVLQVSGRKYSISVVVLE